MSRTATTSTLPLLALASSAFAIGTTEFISVGLLPLVAQDLHVSITTAGLTVSLYALGVTVGAPLLTTMTSKMSRKSLLLWIMIVFILGNIIVASAPNIGILLLGRVVSAFAHGVFMSIGSTLAASLVTEDRKASAISIMFSGLTVATVTGVPLGTFLGQVFSWRYAFWVIVIVGILALIANSLLVPSNMRSGGRMTYRDQLKLLTNLRLVLMFLITALGYGGTFVVFTYLSPLLQEITGFQASTVTIILLVYGIAISIGNVVGGKVANRKPLRALFYMFILQAVILAALTFTAPFQALGLLTILLMGVFSFMSVPGLQLYVVLLAERYVPTGVDVASALNIAAFNVGIAMGSSFGGWITDTMGLRHTPWIGALMVLSAVVLTGWSLGLERKARVQHS